MLSEKDGYSFVEGSFLRFGRSSGSVPLLLWVQSEAFKDAFVCLVLPGWKYAGGNQRSNMFVLRSNRGNSGTQMRRGIA